MIAYIENDKKRHYSSDGRITECGEKVTDPEYVALPVTCDKCRAENGRKVHALVSHSA